MKYFIFYELFCISFLALCTFAAAGYWVTKFTILCTKNLHIYKETKEKKIVYVLIVSNGQTFCKIFKIYLMEFVNKYFVRGHTKISARILLVIFIIFELILYPLDWILILAKTCDHFKHFYDTKVMIHNCY